MLTNIVFIILQFLHVHLVHSQGYTFYRTREENGKTTQKVYDVGHRFLPNWSMNRSLIVIMNASAFLFPFMFGWSVFEEYMSFFVMILILRFLFTTLTILPKEKTCDDQSLGPHSVMFGHCYDKIFSGHFASILLVSLIAVKRKLLTPTNAVLINLLNGWVILVTRSHYTVDLAVALVVTLYIYQMNIRLNL
jgi:hypothetical protein